MGDVVFPTLGALLLALGLAAFIGRRHLLWKIIAVNIMGSGVSILLLTLPARVEGRVDPVPEAMVLTGIVVMVAATALALALAVRLAGLPPERDDGA
jgi:multicomponent Na+:H+ antiporter subunit C